MLLDLGFSDGLQPGFLLPERPMGHARASGVPRRASRDLTIQCQLDDDGPVIGWTRPNDFARHYSPSRVDKDIVETLPQQTVGKVEQRIARAEMALRHQHANLLGRRRNIEVAR